ncbi:hypothetical protein Cpir12675_002717 [Ceratocystis pirilliformis]|uniref:Uncharacterized protein n=1 Tax=Ceratocystis pirilliformis TaxID=259994 RepID=A0ABR3Z7R1_9PEZI
MSGKLQYSAVEPPMTSSSRSAYTATVPPSSSSAFLRPDAPRSDFLAPTTSRGHRRSSSAVDGTVSLGPPSGSRHRMSFSDVRDEQNPRELRDFRDREKDRNRSSRSTHRGTSSDSRGHAPPGIMFSHEASDPSLDKSRRNSIYDKDQRGSGSRSHHGHSHSYSGSASRHDSPEPYSSDEERGGSGKTKKRVLAALAGVVAVGLGVNAIDKKINESNKRRDEIQEEQDRKYERDREWERRSGRDHDHDSRSHYSSHSQHHPSSHSQAGVGVIVPASSRHPDRSDQGRDGDRGRYREKDAVECNRSRARDYRMEVSRDRANYHEARASDDRLYRLGDEEYYDPYSGRNF